MIWLTFAALRPEATPTADYWWLIGLVVYGFIFWLLWSDEKPSKKSHKGTTSGTRQKKTTS